MEEQPQLNFDEGGGRIPLLAECGLYLEAEPEEAVRFTPLFRATWEHLPDTVRRQLLDWWKQLRETRGRCMRWRGRRPHFEEVEPGRYKGLSSPADRAALRGYDWARVPLIAVREVLPHPRAGGMCCWDGAEILFLGEALRAWGAEFIQAAIAHELAHAYAAACGECKPDGCQAATWKRYQAAAGGGWEERLINELIVSWGFYDTTNPEVLRRREDARFQRHMERQFGTKLPRRLRLR